MKKIKLIAPILGLTTAATLGSTLVSCGGDTPVEEMVFTVADATSTDKQFAEIELDWTPSTDSIMIDESSLTFASDAAKGKSFKIIGQDKESRPRKIQMTFTGPAKADITNGVLTFKYENKTTGQKGLRGEVHDIKISFLVYVVDQWTTDRLILNNVSFEAGKEYKVIVDTSKFEDEFNEYPQLRLTNTKYDATIGCDVYYDGTKLEWNKDYICNNTGDDLTCHFSDTFTLEKGKDLYYIISIPNGAMDKTLYFENR